MATERGTLTGVDGRGRGPKQRRNSFVLPWVRLARPVWEVLMGLGQGVNQFRGSNMGVRLGDWGFEGGDE